LIISPKKHLAGHILRPFRHRGYVPDSRLTQKLKLKFKFYMKNSRIFAALVALTAIALAGYSASTGDSTKTQATSDCCSGSSCCTGGACCQK